MSSRVTGFMIALILIVVLFLIINHRDMNRFVVVSYDVEAKDLQGSFKICLLADLHDTTYGDHNDTLIEAIRNSEPDIILFPGDLITAYHAGPIEVQQVHTKDATDFMRALCDIAPVYFSPGNHETKLKQNKKSNGDLCRKMYEEMRAAGITILENESTLFRTPSGEEVRITGLELSYDYFAHFHKYPMKADYLEGRIGALDEAHYTILMAHNPQYFEEYADYGANLTVSGHVHGGVIRLPLLGGVMSPAVIPFPKYDGGIFRIEDKTMVLSRGLGMHTIRVRAGNPGEVVIINVQGSAEKGV